MRKYFEFYNGAKINCGEAALTTLGSELSYLKCKKPILLSSSNATKLGATEKVLSALKAASVDGTILFDALPARPDVDLAKELKSTYLQNGCDGIIAVGGDSAMDGAKTLRLFLSHDCEEIIPLAVIDSQKTKDIPFIAIPTENGTGREASGYLETENAFVSSRAIVPDVVIIDEEVAMAAPTRTIAAGGIAVLANAIEAYLGSEEEDPIELYAEKAIQLIARNLENAIVNDDDEEAYRAVALAGTLAGIAYGNKPYGAAHALAEGLAQISGLPIEEMLTVTLIPAMKNARPTSEDRLKQILLRLTDTTTYAETPDSERGEKAIQAVTEIIERLHKLTNIPTRISETAIQREKFGAIAEAAADKRAAITAIAPIGKKEFLDLLNSGY